MDSLTEPLEPPCGGVAGTAGSVRPENPGADRDKHDPRAVTSADGVPG